MGWGLVPSWAKDPSIGNSLANARSESVHEKPSFRSSFTKGRRCLVPADVYYEWQPVPAGAPRGAKKQPYAIGMRDGAPFMFAALWEFWRPRPTDGTPAGEPIVSCALLTTGPNAVMAPIHDRMPVILPPGAWETWLDPRTPVDALRALLIPYDAQAMRAWPVSTRVNSPRNDDASCVASMTAGEA